MSEIETEFIAAILDPTQDVPGGVTDKSGHRFNVYRNNVIVSLTASIRTGFPAITRLIGSDNMAGLAGLFVRAHPPTDPVLMFQASA